MKLDMITSTAQSMRAAFNGAPCDNDSKGGAHHPGHARCVRYRKRIEAAARQAAYEEKVRAGLVKPKVGRKRKRKQAQNG